MSVAAFLHAVETSLLPRLNSGDASPGVSEALMLTIATVSDMRRSVETLEKTYRRTSLRKGVELNGEAGILDGLTKFASGAARLEEALRKRAAEPAPHPGMPYYGVPLHLIGRAIDRNILH